MEGATELWKNRVFQTRVVSGIAIIPLGFVALVFGLSRTMPTRDGLWLAIPVSLTMIAMGLPLLGFYLRLGWTGFLPFTLGGAGCTALLFSVLQPKSWGLHGINVYFCALGGCCGWLFRLVLFRVNRRPRVPSASAWALAYSPRALALAILLLCLVSSAAICAYRGATAAAATYLSGPDYLFFALLSFLCLVICGVPLLLLLNRFKMVGWLPFAVAGFCLAMTGLLFCGHLFAPGSLFYLGLGIWTGLALRLSLFRRRRGCFQPRLKRARRRGLVWFDTI